MLAAYGWSDVAVPPFCIATDADRAALQAFEDEVIDRLFILNAERAKKEAALGRAPKKSKAAKAGKRSPRAAKAEKSAKKKKPPEGRAIWAGGESSWVAEPRTFWAKSDLEGRSHRRFPPGR